MKLTHVFVFFLLAVPITLPAATHDLWQIGQYDQSPVEFASELKTPARFDVGKSVPAKDWPRFQGLGPPSEVVFSLQDVKGVFTLTVSALIDRPRIPVLHIGINQHEGTFYLHPPLSYSRGDFSYAFDPHESESRVRIEIPSSFFKPGVNSITIASFNE